MRINFTLLLLSISLSTVFAQEGQKQAVNHPNVHKVVVKEVLQANNYTYLRVLEDTTLTWLAIPKLEDARVGNTYYYQGGMNMGKFTSKDLDRTFDDIVFLNGVVDPEIVEGGGASATPKAPKPKNEIDVVEDISVEPAKGGITIAQLFEKPNKYKNKRVKISGQVTKYSSKILGVNWIHLQDGSGHDFTCTSKGEAAVGDIITVEGKITLDKDFGAGYRYAIIMEEAKILK